MLSPQFSTRRFSIFALSWTPPWALQKSRATWASLAVPTVEWASLRPIADFLAEIAAISGYRYNWDAW